MRRKWIIVLAVIVVLALVAGILAVKSGDRLHAPARKQWKEQALSDITGRIADANWLALEMKKVKASAASDTQLWFSDGLIVMSNADWIAYAAECSKKDSRIHDIFIGRGSDGKWYYSTYHFCIGMLELRMDDQSESLTNFLAKYFAREFDGRSDDCLEKTWPPLRR